MSQEVHGFQTEVSKLLNLLANSIYSNKEIFLRELISNASDAIDKLHFLSLTDASLLGKDAELKIRVRADKDKKTLTISDNGIGMTLEEANDHLGTIAKSGTEEFFKNLSGDAAKDSQLIGQFGIGFYSSFIVADKVTVISRSAKAEADKAVFWESEGNGTFTSGYTTRSDRGTDVILHLKDDQADYLETWTLRSAITKYSDHISSPVFLYEEKYDPDAKPEEKKPPVFDYVQVNDAKALWTLNPREVKDEQYKDFYEHLTHDYEAPLTWAHNRVEGDMEYTSLLYVPSRAPWDLYSREKQHGLKLFVQRVFIMDEAEQFLPNYLRFIKGLVDTNDLPLNVSRELLQESVITNKLKKALTKRTLTMLEKLSEKKDDYAKFWLQFGRVLKEGPLEDPSNQEAVAKLLRFASTAGEGSTQSVSLKDYVSRMVKGQTKIYYLIASSYETAANSPYLETLKKKGIEVLLMTERIDEWLMNGLTQFDGKDFVSASASDLQLGDLADKVEKKTEEKATEDALVARVKKSLGERVQDVRATERLDSFAGCVVAESGQLITAQMRYMLEAAGQPVPETKYILELNIKHPIVAKMSAETDENTFREWAEFILDQAILSEQGVLKDPSGFVKRMNELMSR